MTTVSLSPSPILQFFTAAGVPLVGGTLLTQVAGVNYPTYSDPAGTVQLPNPITLNSRGEVATSSGTSTPMYLVAGVAYTYTLYDALGNQVWGAPNVSVPTFTQASLGAILFPRTLIEGAAATALNYSTMPFADVRRYGCVCDGATDDTAALQVALNVTATWGLALVIPYGYTIKITSYVQLPSNCTLYILGKVQLTARASGFYSNGASNIGVYGCKIGQIQDSNVVATYAWNTAAFNLAPAIHIRSSNHVTIDGLNLSYCAQGIFISNATANYNVPGTPFFPTQAFPTDIKVRDCTMTFCEWSGVANLSSYDSGFYNNYVYRCGDGGMWMMGSIRGSVVGNTRTGPQTVYADTVTFGQNSAAHPTTWNDVQGLEFEVCHDLLIADNAVSYIQGEAIDIKQSCTRVQCTGNRLSYNEQFSIVVREGDAGDTNACYKVTISDNIISNHGYTMFSTTPQTSIAAAISVSSDFETVVKDNTIHSYQTTYGIYCGGPGAYLSGQYSGNQQQAHLDVSGNVFQFMASNPYDTSEFQYTATTRQAILIGGSYTSVVCDGNKVNTDRYYYTDARISTVPAIQVVVTTAGAGLYYPTNLSVCGNQVTGWGLHGINVQGQGAATYSGAVVSNNSVAGCGGYGILIATLNFATVCNNSVAQPNNSVTNSYTAINFSGTVTNPLTGVVATGNTLTGPWNVGGNNLAYNIGLNYCVNINLSNTVMAGANSGTISTANITGNVVLTGSTGFPRTGGATPNGSVTSFYIGEEYFDTVGLAWWKASTFQSTVWTKITN
jgi:hypothetical protein